LLIANYIFYWINKTIELNIQRRHHGYFSILITKVGIAFSYRELGVPSIAGHILSRIYNCTKPGNRSIDNTAAAHFTLHISILQLHKL